jgi:hypothetical protein
MLQSLQIILIYFKSYFTVHEKCMKDKNIISSESPPESWFCGDQCQQVL